MRPTSIEDLELALGRDLVIERALAIRDRARRGIIPTHGPGSGRTAAPTVTVEPVPREFLVGRV